jgi:hypothetical protein
VISEHLSPSKVDSSPSIETQISSLLLDLYPCPYPYSYPDSLSYPVPCSETLLINGIKMRRNIVVNSPVTFKSNLIVDNIDVLPHFIDLLLDSGKSKSAFGVDECDQKTMSSTEFETD